MIAAMIAFDLICIILSLMRFDFSQMLTNACKILAVLEPTALTLPDHFSVSVLTSMWRGEHPNWVVIGPQLTSPASSTSTALETLLVWMAHAGAEQAIRSVASSALVTQS